MTFMKGGDLFSLIDKKKKFPEEVAKFYCATISLALEHLHKNDIIYRDLKFENVLMDETGYVSLCDYGISKIVK